MPSARLLVELAERPARIVRIADAQDSCCQPLVEDTAILPFHDASGSVPANYGARHRRPHHYLSRGETKRIGSIGLT
jgi:hypothetical protein